MSNNNRGFTLIELIIVLGIIGILGAISIPVWINWQKSAQYREAAQLAVSALMQAKSEAINTNRSVSVVFTLDGSSANSGNTVKVGSQSAVSFASGIDIKGNNDCSVDADTVTITFNPNGTSVSRYICILEGSTKKYRVGIGKPTTGRVLSQRWAGSDWQ